jgi:hypothetical protein
MDGRLRLDKLAIRPFRLNDLGEAFAAMTSRPDGFLKAVAI